MASLVNLHKISVKRTFSFWIFRVGERKNIIDWQKWIFFIETCQIINQNYTILAMITEYMFHSQLLLQITKALLSTLKYVKT